MGNLGLNTFLGHPEFNQYNLLASTGDFISYILNIE